MQPVRSVRPDLGAYAGKGEALWKSQFVTSGRRARLHRRRPDRVGHRTSCPGLLGPLLTRSRGRAGEGLLRPACSTTARPAATRRRAAGSPSWSPGRCINLHWPAAGGRRAAAGRRVGDPALGVRDAVGPDRVRRRARRAARRVSQRTGWTRSRRSTSARAAHSHQSVHDLGVMAAEILAVARRGGLGRSSRPSRRELWQFDRDGPPAVARRPVPLDRASAGDRRPPERPMLQARASRHVRRRRDADHGDRQPDAGLVLRQGRDLRLRRRRCDRVREVVADGAEIVDIGGVKAAPGVEVDDRGGDRSHGRRSSPRCARSSPTLVISVDTWRHEVGDGGVRGRRRRAQRRVGRLGPRARRGGRRSTARRWCARTPAASSRAPVRTGSTYDDVMADVLAADGRRWPSGRSSLGVSRVVGPDRSGARLRQEHPALARGDPPAGGDGGDRLAGAGVAVEQGLRRREPRRAVGERLIGTLATTSVSAWLGARVFRAHNVAETRQTLDMVATIRGDRPPARTVRGLA